MKNNIVERLLYIALVLVFIGMGLAFYILVLIDHGQNVQIKSLQQLNLQQEQTISEIKTAVDELKGDNAQNTKYLECIISLHAQGIVPSDQSCAITTPPTATTAPTPVATQTPTPSPAPAPTPAPTPSPTPTPPANQLSNVISRLLKKVGL